MGRFHRHADGTYHEHDGGADDHRHDTSPPSHRDVGDHSGYTETGVSRSPCSRTSSPRTTASPTPTAHDLRRAGVRSVNLMSSPGAGKTDVAQAFARDARRAGAHRHPRRRHRDEPRRGPARRPRRGGRARQHECRLRRRVPPRRSDGAIGLAAPAARPSSTCWSSRTSATSSARRSSTSAQDARAMVYAVTEGEEKPLKYPVMFRSATSSSSTRSTSSRTSTSTSTRSSATSPT